MNAVDRHLAVPGALLRYRDEGAGAALVFVHGWTLDLEMWEPQAAFAADFRTLRYDRRGFGLSTGRPSLADDVADLRSLLATLGVVSPLLVGMSQGARVVLEFAARYPGVARGLVLDGPPPFAEADALAVDGDLPMSAFRETAQRSGLPAFCALWSAHPFTRLITSDARIHALLAEILARYPGHDLTGPAAPQREFLDERQLGGIHIPALIINGAFDVSGRRGAGRRLQSLLRDSSLSIVDDAAHLPNLDAPAAYNDLICEFACRLMSAAA
jgi:pimeloyl-ACP methyl ester carboxylesterase